MSGEAKTEQPTPRKLRKAREKGSVAKSKDFAMALSVSAVLVALWMAGSLFWQFMIEMVHMPLKYLQTPFRQALAPALGEAAVSIAVISIPIIALVMILDVLAHVLQFGFIFAVKQITPDIKRIDPANQIKSMFSLSKLTELVKSVVKMALLATVCYLIIKAAVPALSVLPFWGVEGALELFFATMKRIVAAVIIIFLVVAIVDILIQRQLFIRQNKMSKTEVKREHKDQEGDPEITGQRKQFHRDIVQGSMWEGIKKADIVVTNPTHIAVALYHHREKTGVPMVVAKGKRMVAKRIIKIAIRADVPIMRNVPLAHDLYNKVEINGYIPNELFRPVAEVLRWVKQKKGKHKKPY